MIGPTLESDRLTLRPPIEADLDGWAELLGDEESTRYIGGQMPRAAAWRAMSAMTGSWPLRGFGMFSVIERASGRWIGRLGPWSPEGWPGTEVGWALLRDACGKGYATEGAVRAIDWAFDHLGWTEVIHTINPENHGSIKVAQRLGSAWRGPGAMPAPFEHLPVDIWGQTREQWRTRSSR